MMSLEMWCSLNEHYSIGIHIIKCEYIPEDLLKKVQLKMNDGFSISSPDHFRFLWILPGQMNP